MKKITYTKGDIIGKCVFIMDTPSDTKHRQALFTCPRCSSTFKARVSHVKAEKTISCGCLLKQESHGESNTRLYHIWEAMKQRCLNPSHPKFKDYGKRGITITKEWLTYTAFKNWAEANAYSDKLTIDRIDNDKGYSPDNCRFTDRSTQMANSNSGRKAASGYKGVEISKQGKFTARLCIKGKRITIGTYATALEAATARDKYIKDNNLPHLLSLKNK